MTPGQIDRYFKIFSRQITFPLQIYLTEAAAGSLLGNVRPSLDLDFGVRLPGRRGKKREALWKAVEEAAALASARSGVASNYAEDLDRWSSITYLDYRTGARHYKKFGQVTVKILDPAYWSIGKIARYLDPDVLDLVKVLAARKVSSRRLTTLWARALRTSPRSTACFLFAKHVEHFLSAYGQKIWGPAFHAGRAIDTFRRQAQLL